ncbi:MAG TPA: hypothetical protein VFQ38_21120 [Longimicrobiales bacterium]|nr:hypothetical protein [Longimicrobiales bacterium]
MTWLTVALLGAYHGVNPAMGWLFAVALGLQERRAVAVLRALPPIALGHAASVALVIAATAWGLLLVPPVVVRWAGAAVLLGFAAFLVVRRFPHPRWVGMRVGFRDLVLWSFLMSSAHGAGLMLVPVLLRLPAGSGHAHAGPLPARPDWHAGAMNGIGALGLHGAAMFATMAAVALLVFRLGGLGVLRRAWINLDMIWAGALVLAGVLTLVLG